MKTETVYIKEFKVLKDQKFELGGNHILVMGDNGVGKSSLLQFIQIALGKQTNVPANIQGEGMVVMNKDGKNITFSVKFKDGKPVIDVKGEGVYINNKKGAIAELVGALDFDIDKFVEMSKTDAGRKKQVEIYKSFLPFEVIEFMNIMESKIKASYDERTSLNRDIKNLDGSINLHPLINNIAELGSYAQINIESVYEDLKKAQAHNASVEKIKTGVAEKNKSVKDIEEQIKALEDKKTSILVDIEKGNAWLTKNVLIDLTSMEHSIQTATEQNGRYSQAQQLISDMKKLEGLKESVGELSALIESSKAAIIETIKQIDSPVDGLTYDEDGLYWNGIAVNPDNLSTSEIIELGIRLKMAENPDLGVLFIEHGESIGSDRLKVIKDLADKNGWQLIMEQVERGNKLLHLEIMADES